MVLGMKGRFSKFEQESLVREYRIKSGVTILDLANICGCYKNCISELGDGRLSPLYDKEHVVDGVIYSEGDIKPFVAKMLEIFDAKFGEVFPKYASEIEEKENLLEYFGSVDDRDDGGKVVNSLERKLTFTSFWELVDNKLSSRELDVLKKHYFEDMYFEDISKDHELTRERIRQIHRDSINKIRGLFEENYRHKSLRKDLEVFL